MKKIWFSFINVCKRSYIFFATFSSLFFSNAHQLERYSRPIFPLNLDPDLVSQENHWATRGRGRGRRGMAKMVEEGPVRDKARDVPRETWDPFLLEVLYFYSSKWKIIDLRESLLDPESLNTGARKRNRDRESESSWLPEIRKKYLNEVRRFIFMYLIT